MTNQKCRHCNEEIKKTPGGHWVHVSLEAQVFGKYPIHSPQPVHSMVEEEGFRYNDV